MTALRSHRRAPAAALALAALAAIAGCSDDRALGEKLAHGYVDALAAAYRQNDPRPAAPLLGEHQLRKLTALIDLKRNAGLVLESTVESLEVTGVERPGPDQLVVTTRERWSYQDRPLAPGAPAGTRFVVVLGLRYAFSRAGGTWRLEEAKALSSEQLEPRPGAAAP